MYQIGQDEDFWVLSHGRYFQSRPSKNFLGLLIFQVQPDTSENICLTPPNWFSNRLRVKYRKMCVLSKMHGICCSDIGKCLLALVILCHGVRHRKISVSVRRFKKIVQASENVLLAPLNQSHGSGTWYSLFGEMNPLVCQIPKCHVELLLVSDHPFFFQRTANDWRAFTILRCWQIVTVAHDINFWKAFCLHPT